PAPVQKRLPSTTVSTTASKPALPTATVSSHPADFSTVEQRRNLCAESALEGLLRKARGVGTGLGGREFTLPGFKALDRAGQRLGCLRKKENAGPRVDRLERSTRSERDDRPAGCLGLDRNDAEVLLGGEDHRSRLVVELGQLGFADLPEHVDI